ncbi:STAS domain-containing protein [Thermoactinospora rubra]|uniref:STAS domain-containing protein n=1 Tax=Thermoactinospora rubra TaxID=1088767 RepID=UPI00130209CC|nr:STAS domain-containing protein [Thermoactinospora rubra]
MDPTPPSRPAPSSLRVCVQAWPEASATVVTLFGELDWTTIDVFAAELALVPGEPVPPRIVLDLAGLDFCDSAGLSALIKVWNGVQQSGGALVMAGVRGRCERLFQVTGLSRVFAFYPTVADARGALGAPPVEPV